MTAQTIALITGANKGIGFEVAKQLGQRGMVVLSGRPASRILAQNLAREVSRT